MLFPQDTPGWVERLFEEIEEKVDRQLVNAKSSDDAMRSAGAYALWRSIKEQVDAERKNEEYQIKQRNERLNARNPS
jgi:hypothetical protein